MLTNHITLHLLVSLVSPILSTLYPLPFLPFLPCPPSSYSPSVSSPLSPQSIGYTFIPCLEPFPTHPCVSGDFSPSCLAYSLPAPFICRHPVNLVYFYSLLLISRSSKSRSFVQFHLISRFDHSAPDSFAYPVIHSSILDSFSHSSKRNCHHCWYVIPPSIPRIGFSP